MRKLICLLAAVLMIAALAVNAFADSTVQSMIEGLPAVEEFQTMDSDAQLEAYNQVQAAYDVYMALSDAERSEIAGAEETFETLFAHFNSLIMPVEEVAVEAAAEEVAADSSEEKPPMILIVMAAFVAGFAFRNLNKKR